MSNSTVNPNFVPRSNLNRTLTYRPHVKWTFYLVILAGVAISFLEIVDVLFHGTSFTQYLGHFALSAILFLEAWLLLKPLAYSTVTVAPDKITLDRLSKKIEIPLNAIIAIKFNFIPYLGGWFSITLPDGKTYKFTVVLERSEYVLEAIASSNPQLISTESLMKYRRIAILADHGWARFYDTLKEWKLLLTKFVGLPIVAALLISLLQLALQKNPDYFKKAFFFDLFLLVALSLLLGFAIGTIADLIIVNRDKARFTKEPQATLRDIPYENKIRARTTLIHYCIFGLVVLLLITLSYLRS
ncbi:hypothetical protein D3C87_101900 [compost metagenome]